MAGTGRVSKVLPQANAEASDAPLRAGRYGETYTVGPPTNKYALADEGSYFVATSVIDTPIQASVATVYSATASTFIFIRNTESTTASAPKRIYLDYIKLLVKTIPASAVELQYACHIDNGASTFTSTGTNITPVNTNGDITATSIVGTTMYVGACVTTARTNGRLVGRGRFKAFIPVTYDQYILTFGNVEMSGGALAASNAAAGTSVVGGPPVIVAPGWNFTLSLYGTSWAASGGTFEVEIGWWER